MNANWPTFKSKVRNRISQYYAPDMIEYVMREIIRAEKLGFREVNEKYGINILHLFSMLRWVMIYGNNHRRNSKPFGTNDFVKIYTGIHEMGGREIPRELSSKIRLQIIMRNNMRNQQPFQTNAMVVFAIFATILLKYCSKEELKKLAIEMGFDSIEDFICAHYVITLLQKIENTYVRPLSYYRSLKKPQIIANYLARYIPDMRKYREKLEENHKKNKDNNMIWKEADDIGWYIWNPLIRNEKSITVLSMNALSHFSGYGMASILSTNHKWFYESSFAEGFHKFVYKQLESNSKIVLREADIGALIPGETKRPDAFIENGNDAVFIEFKSNKSPNFMFEHYDIEKSRQSVRSSLYKGMNQIFKAMRRYKELDQSKNVYGIIVTLYEYHSGLPEIFAEEILNQSELEEYVNEIHNYGITSICDFMKISQQNLNEFMDEIKNRISRKHFYQFADTDIRISNIKELSDTTALLTEMAIGQIQ